MGRMGRGMGREEREGRVREGMEEGGKVTEGMEGMRQGMERGREGGKRNGGREGKGGDGLQLPNFNSWHRTGLSHSMQTGNFGNLAFVKYKVIPNIQGQGFGLQRQGQRNFDLTTKVKNQQNCQQVVIFYSIRILCMHVF